MGGGSVFRREVLESRITRGYKSLLIDGARQSLERGFEDSRR